MPDRVKKCNTCGKEQSLSEFYTRDSGQLITPCKGCQKVRRAKYWRENKDTITERRNSNPKVKDARDKNNKRHNKKIRSWILTYLSSHPCVHCGETDPVVLEFDHLDPKTKDFGVSRATSIKKLENEVKKCQVLCANCHRRKTAKNNDWYKFKGIE